MSDLSVNEMKKNIWRQRLIDQKRSGMTVVDYCVKNNLSIKCYYYWHKKIGNEVYNSVVAQSDVTVPSAELPDLADKAVPQFVPVDLSSNYNNSPESCTARIHIGEATIEISDNISDELLLRIMKAASHV
jgi:hypothetical protein